MVKGGWATGYLHCLRVLLPLKVLFLTQGKGTLIAQSSGSYYLNQVISNTNNRTK